jgi:hypothetical protein
MFQPDIFHRYALKNACQTVVGAKEYDHKCSVTETISRLHYITESVHIRGLEKSRLADVF